MATLVQQKHYWAALQKPQKNQPNYTIKDNFWKDQNFQILPYRKGALFAFWLDNQILKKSNYTKSLDDLMRDILLKSTTENRNFTDDWFLDLVQPYLDKNIAYYFQKHIISNVDIDFASDDVIKGLKVAYVDKIPVFQLTADKEQAKATFLNQKWLANQQQKARPQQDGLSVIY